MFKFLAHIFCCSVGHVAGNFNATLPIFNIVLNLHVTMYMHLAFYNNNYGMNTKNLNCFTSVQNVVV